MEKNKLKTGIIIIIIVNLIIIGKTGYYFWKSKTFYTTDEMIEYWNKMAKNIQSVQ